MDRETFLARIRQSLEGVEPSQPPPAYQPPDPPGRRELTAKFCQELTALGGKVHSVSSASEARDSIRQLLQEREAKQIIRGDTPLTRQLDLDDSLRQAGIEVQVARLDEATSREPLRAAAFSADIGITSADFAVAETGTLALLAEPGQGRAVSLLPPVHVAVLEARDIVLELAALLERVEERGALPSALTFISGPSLTGDIEQKLTVGVHGPGELHVVVIDEER